MSLQEEEEATVHVENIGGIDESTVTLSPGVTVLSGRNATNRTSFLQAIMGAYGSDNVTIKGDSDEAYVELTIGSETYTRSLRETNGTTTSSGDPYRSDTLLADLFSFLLESNDARRAVARGDDLRELIMRPVDTDKIQIEIDQLLEERRNINEKIEDIDSKKKELPALEEKRTKLQEQIEIKKDNLKETEDELEVTDVEEKQEEKQELEDKLDELHSKRSTLEDVRYDIETEQKTIKELKQEKNDLEQEKTEHSGKVSGEMKSIKEKINRLRDQKQTLDSGISDLQSVIQFNEEMLNEINKDTFEAVSENSGPEGPVTDQLLEDETTICWTCGREVESDQIETIVNNLKELSQEKTDKVDNIESDIKGLEKEHQNLKKEQNKRKDIESRIDQIKRELEKHNRNVEKLKHDRDRLINEIGTIEEEVKSLEDESHNEILDLHKEANQLEYQLGKLENNLENIENKISRIESCLSERKEFVAQRKDITEKLEDLQTKIEQTEQQAIDEFNEHMDTVLSLLNYENIDRIWLERVEKEVREGRQKVIKSKFNLHVIRKTDSGAVYEDTVDHLSESEREVTGLIFALAGYLVHEVYEFVPFMLLDSLEAIDSERISTLVNYLKEYNDYFIIALLPGDAQVLDDKYDRIHDI